MQAHFERDGLCQGKRNDLGWEAVSERQSWKASRIHLQWPEQVSASRHSTCSRLKCSAFMVTAIRFGPCYVAVTYSQLRVQRADHDSPLLNIQSDLYKSSGRRRVWKHSISLCLTTAT